MGPAIKAGKRPYHAPRRAAAAARTREAIVTAAKDLFERLGWSGVTMRRVAEEAGVSLKTVEALCGTKAQLLKLVVDFAIAGDLRPVPVIAREAVAAMEAAPDAATMLRLHAHHVRSVHERAVSVAWVVEQAAPTDDELARLWATMTDHRRVGVRWAAATVLGKTGLAPDVDRAGSEDVFWVATDFAVYRSFTHGRGLDPTRFEAWLRRFYAKMLLARARPGSVSEGAASVRRRRRDPGAPAGSIG